MASLGQCLKYSWLNDRTIKAMIQVTEFLKRPAWWDDAYSIMMA